MRIKITICLLLIGVTAACFWRVTGNGFVNYDDSLYVTDNSHVQAGLSLQGVKWAFTTGENANWHPLTWLSHMLDVELYDLKPWGHHLTSLLLHILNTVLLFLLLARMTGSLWRSGLVAALFGVHPLHVESVAWVAERKDVLSTLFWILTMWAYVRYAEHPGVKRYLPVAVLFALGLSAKPMLVTLPFVLLLLDYWPLRRYAEFKVQSSKFNVGSQVANTQHPTPNTGSTSPRRLVWEKAPLFALAAASSIVTYIVQQKGGAVVTLEKYSTGVRAANALVAYVGYMAKMLWPGKLAVFYPHPDRGLPLWQVVGAGVVLALITGLVIRAGKPRPYLAVGWLWYLGTLFPVIGLIQVGSQAMADRYTYVALIGLFVMIAWAPGEPRPVKEQRGGKRKSAPTSKLPHSHTPILPALALIAIAAIAVRSWAQAGYWQDGLTLYRHALDVTPNNAIMRYNMGVALARRGDVEQAMEHFQEAVRLQPNYAQVYHNMGVLLDSRGMRTEAIEAYREAVRLKPNLAESHNNLAVALYGRGDYAGAWEEVRICRELGFHPHPEFLEALSKKMAEP